MAKNLISGVLNPAKKGTLQKMSAGRNGGRLAKVADDGGLKKQTVTPMKTDRGSFGMKS
jgi:hypothetical protein